MKIEIKRSINPINYNKAISILNNKVDKIINNKVENELIWFLEHPYIFTSGTSFKKEDILDNSIKVIKTSRGGKITWHGPGQLICYLAIDLNKRSKDIRRFINTVEKSIIETLKEYNIKTHSDKKNVGIWYSEKNKIKKVAAIGFKIRRWVAYHGFSLNIDNNLDSYKKINACGIKDKGITNLVSIKKQNYSEITNKLEKYLTNYLKI